MGHDNVCLVGHRRSATDQHCWRSGQIVTSVCRLRLQAVLAKGGSQDVDSFEKRVMAVGYTVVYTVRVHFTTKRQPNALICIMV
jgi:hypothetical protein